MSQPPKQCLVRHYLIDPYEIHYLRFIVEAYPGIGVLSTTTPRSGFTNCHCAGMRVRGFRGIGSGAGKPQIREVDPDSDLLRNLAGTS